MEFRTEISIPPAQGQIDYSSNILLLGSCFSDHIGHQLNYYKFQCGSNPFGVLFHPLAIEKIIYRAIAGEKIKENECIHHNELWHHLDFHSTISQVVKADLIKKVNQQLNALSFSLATTSHICITLGTAWIFRHISSNTTVANCHKIPQIEFEKSLLSVAEIQASLVRLIAQIKKVNKKAQIIFTVSPIRHLKDGMVENQQSKAHLLTAIHQLTNTKQIHYFPAYEILLDDLRDYRFYKENMIHPTGKAIDYIWNKFKGAWIDPNSFDLMKKVATIQQGLAHRPIHPKSAEHEKFLQKLEIKMIELRKTLAHITF